MGQLSSCCQACPYYCKGSTTQRDVTLTCNPAHSVARDRQTRQRLHINPHGPRINNLSLVIVSQVCPCHASHATPRRSIWTSTERPVPYGVRIPPRGQHAIPSRTRNSSSTASPLLPGHWQSGAASPTAALTTPTLLVHHGGPASERQHLVYVMIFRPRDLKNQLFDPWSDFLGSSWQYWTGKHAMVAVCSRMASRRHRDGTGALHPRPSPMCDESKD